MVPSGVAEVVELIWHFSGYLRLDPDGVARVNIDYTGAYPPPEAPDQPPDNIINSYKPTPQDVDSDPSPPVSLLGPDEYKWIIHQTARAAEIAAPVHELKTASLPLKPPLLPPAADGDGGGGGINFISIDPLVNQEIVDLRQVNNLINDDYASVGPTILPLEPLDAWPMLAPMLVDAQHAVPVDLLPEEGTSTSLLEFVNDRDADPVAAQSEESPYTVSSGTYVNGELQDPATDVHQITNEKIDVVTAGLDGRVEQIPENLGPDVGIQKMSLGDNIVANDAVINSDSGLCGSMLILGNSYQLEAIFQTNVVTQTDHFEITPTGDAGINFIPNVVQNIADISDTGAIDGPWTAAGPLHWSVNVLHGSLFDVKAMSQVNYISDNDVVSQTQSLGYSMILAGSNEQANVIDFESPMGQWDLIVIEGNYHRLDMINQTNVVLNVNYASQGWTGSGGEESASQGITAGNNAVINDASIIYFGATGSLGVTDDMIKLAQVLATETAPDASTIANAFPELMGTIHVLYVEGDYYNVNYLSQTNIISDANVAAQLLTKDGSGEQSISTGNNLALNVATIVDTGSLTTPYVQGTAYSDTILLQTNIITTDSKVVTNDPAQLAPEVVAFTGTDASDHPNDTPQLFAPPPQDVQHHSSDVLSGTLH
ncbi:MAG TPA: hypothetical protein VH558_16905 [Pseudolabrys sp.]|jgi:hypothetical protein